MSRMTAQTMRINPKPHHSHHDPALLVVEVDRAFFQEAGENQDDHPRVSQLPRKRTRESQHQMQLPNAEGGFGVAIVVAGQTASLEAPGNKLLHWAKMVIR